MNPMLKDFTDDALRRKAAQAWEMAGLARKDKDLVDANRWTNKAREYERELREREKLK